MVDNTRGFDSAGMYKAGGSDDLTGSGLGVAKALDGGDGVWVNGPTIDVSYHASIRVMIGYVPASEASVDLQGMLSDDAGVTWYPASVVEPAAAGVLPLKNDPLRITPTGTSSIGVDGKGSILFGCSADQHFRMRWRVNTPSGGATLYLRGRRGSWT